MARKTVAVVVPVVLTKKGDLAAGEAFACKSIDDAKRRLASVASRWAGAVAFTRTGDPEMDEFDDPVLLEVCGTVPPEVLAEIVPMPF